MITFTNNALSFLFIHDFQKRNGYKGAYIFHIYICCNILIVTLIIEAYEVEKIISQLNAIIIIIIINIISVIILINFIILLSSPLTTHPLTLFMLLQLLYDEGCLTIRLFIHRYRDK